MTHTIDDHPFAADLLRWYDANRHPLPWRANRDPYRVWLSEVMLQQTQVETVKPYFDAFTNLYPTVRDLAAAPLDDVLKLWEGLGYYSRARSMHRTARIVTEQHGGVFPNTVDGLLALPGIGRYTAGAIASIAYDVPAPVLDGNVIRVFSRLLDSVEDVTKPKTIAALWDTAEQWTPDARAGDYNQALMELGRLICKPRNPLCGDCPIRAHCAAYAHDTQAERPIKAPKAKTPHYDVTAGMIWDDQGRLLIAQRPAEGLLGGLWEFPGGKQEDGETLEACLKRELREELAIEVSVCEVFAVVKHAFTHFRITLHAFTCRYVSGEPQALGVQAWRWVTEDELREYAFGKADRAVIDALEKRRGMMF